jgi:NAD(P)-dependent dehydrogenase (short-subunit alcohol dehydrogenase family)
MEEPMKDSLVGLHVVVTGAGGGLGPAVVEAFQAAGALVHAPSRKELDLSDEKTVRTWYAALPGLWASVHVAGGFSMAALEDTTLADLSAQWNINTVTSFLCCREAVRRMKAGGGGDLGIPGGRIVNVGSRAAVEHPGGKIAYVTAKGALVAMTRAIAAEVKPAGILVNAVLPDTIDTPANRAAMPGADYSKWTPPEAIASAIAWLASPDNASVTGTLAPV